MLTRSTPLSQPSSAGSPLVRSLSCRPVAHARGSADNARRMASSLRAKALRMHQWSIISPPDACEALCHRRGTIEPMLANGTLEPSVAAHLDLVNMFGNAEWPCIRHALLTHFMEESAWTEWQHQSDTVTTLPTGVVFATNRGGEQGDVATSGSLMVGRSSFCRGRPTDGFELRKPPLGPSGLPVTASRVAT